MITYQNQNGSPRFHWDINVYLDGKKVGEIRSYTDGFGYVPKGKRQPDQIYPSLKHVKAVLESDE